MEKLYDDSCGVTRPRKWPRRLSNLNVGRRRECWRRFGADNASLPAHDRTGKAGRGVPGAGFLNQRLFSANTGGSSTQTNRNRGEKRILLAETWITARANTAALNTDLETKRGIKKQK